jgi:integrase
MPRQHRNARLQTRDARGKLAPSKEPYWHEVERGRSIGYYRGQSGGSWWLREYVARMYRKRRLGRADDVNEADGVSVLSFKDAVRLALSDDRTTQPSSRHYTVDDALDDYFEFRKAASPPGSLDRDRVAANAWIVPLADPGQSGASTAERRLSRLRASLHRRAIASLTANDLRRWRNSLVPINRDPEERRRAQATANRVWTILRAALNHAFENENIASDHAWRRIKPFKNADRPQTRFLKTEECRRLIDAAAPDFRQLVRGCLLTGLRLGELLALLKHDFEDGHITVIHSKTASSRRVPLNAEGAEFFRSVTDGKSRNDPIFITHDGTAWTKIRVSRAMRKACSDAKIVPPLEFRQLRTTYGSLLLNADAPLSTISELLGHKDTRMTRRHYAHLLSEKLKETVDTKLPSFG